MDRQITSAATPPVRSMTLPARSQRPDDGPALPPRNWNKLQSPTVTPTGFDKNNYDRVVLVETKSDDKDKHTYLEVKPQNFPANNIDSRIRKVEEMQTLLSKQFVEFKTDITTEILSLKNITMNLATFMQESSINLHSAIEKIHFHTLENSDHLGKQIMDVRRDIVSANKRQASVSGPTPPHTYIHCFEWEIASFDSMVKNKKESTSQFCHIAQIDCKIYGGAICYTDERLRFKLFGDIDQSSRTSLQKGIKFECSVHMVDKSGKQPNWLVGKVFGDFNSGREWIVGDVSSSEVKKRGFVARSGNAHLKFTIEICL